MAASRLCAALIGAAMCAAGPAAAIGDLTGVYEGSLTCESTTDVESARTKLAATLLVDDHGSGNAFLYLNNSLQVFRAAVVSAPETPDQGRLGGPSCSVSPLTGGWVIHAEVKAKPGSPGATLRGEFVTLGVGASAHSVQVCRFSLKRTSLEDPGIAGCP
jgi:hypothetical protein